MSLSSVRLRIKVPFETDYFVDYYKKYAGNLFRDSIDASCFEVLMDYLSDCSNFRKWSKKQPLDIKLVAHKNSVVNLSNKVFKKWLKIGRRFFDLPRLNNKSIDEYYDKTRLRFYPTDTIWKVYLRLWWYRLPLDCPKAVLAFMGYIEDDKLDIFSALAIINSEYLEWDRQIIRTLTIYGDPPSLLRVEDRQNIYDALALRNLLKLNRNIGKTIKWAVKDLSSFQDYSPLWDTMDKVIKKVTHIRGMVVSKQKLIHDKSIRELMSNVSERKILKELSKRNISKNFSYV